MKELVIYGVMSHYEFKRKLHHVSTENYVMASVAKERL